MFVPLPTKSLAVAPALLAWALSCQPAPPTPERPRHALLVTVDSLRADHCSFLLYGRPTTRAPQGLVSGGVALDDLAREGVAYAQAFSPSPFAEASLATLLTGEDLFTTTIYTDEGGLPEGMDTLPQVLQRGGFETVGLVARANGPLPAGLELGFSRFELLGEDREVLAAAKQLVAGRDWDGAAPLFLWLHLEGPRPPLQGGVEIWPGYPDAPIEFGPLFAEPAYRNDENGGERFVERVRESGPKPLEPHARRHVIDLYDGELAYLSAGLAGFMFAFREVAPQEWERTGTVVCGVNGFALPDEYGWKPLRGLEDEHLHVPLLFHAPRSLQGPRIQGEAVGLVRVAPTLAAWLGLGGPARWQPPLPEIVAGPIEGVRPVQPVLGFCPPLRLYALRTNDWRLVVDEGTLRGMESYMRLRPVRNMRQLPVDVTYQELERVDHLRKEILAWFMERAQSDSQ